MRITDIIELILLAAIWGASFLFMRTATPEFGAVALVAVRTGVAALCLLPFLLAARKVKDVKGHWRDILIVGIINTAIPFCLFSYATVLLGAGMGSVLNATAPMFGAVIAYFWLKEQLKGFAVLGLLTGFVGVVVLTNARTGLDLSTSLLPVLAALGATFAYGLAACFTKRNLSGVNTLAIAAGSQAFAAVILLPLAVFSWPETMPSTQAWGQALVLGVACTGIAYILYFRLIANVGAARAISVAYLIPAFGVLWGVLFINETVSPALLTGAALILVGVGLTTGMVKWPRKKFV